MTAHRAYSVLAQATGVLLIVGTLLFLLLPLIVVAASSLSPDDRPYVAFPPSGVSFRWYENIPFQYWQALVLSIALAAGTAVTSTIIAIPIAFGLIRARFPGKAVLSLLLRAPLQIPYVVTGIAFLQLYYLLSGATGLQLRETYPGLLLGHTFLATPYAIASIVAVLARFNRRLEEAGASLGANSWRIFWRITLPVIAPGIFSGALYAFVISFGEVPVSLFVGGAARSTLPVTIFSSMQFDFGPALLAISTIVLVASFLAIFLIQKIVGLNGLTRPASAR